MKCNHVFTILLACMTFFTASQHVLAAASQQLLPWPKDVKRSAYRVETTGIAGYTAQCEDTHSDPKQGKVDFGLSSTDQVIAAEGGEVVSKVNNCGAADDCNGGWGNGVRIKSAADRYNQYAHFSYVSNGFNLGDIIKTGQFLGNPGDTGVATGVHLHFERWNCSTQSCSTYPTFFEGTEQVFANLEGRLVCGDYISKNITCSPPTSGTWIIDTDCSIAGQVRAPARVTVTNNAILTLVQGGKLDINFANYALYVSPGSRVKVLPGGTIY